MAFEAPRSRIPLKQIQTQKQMVPFDQILQVQGQSPVANGITEFGNVVGQALAKQRALQLQGQQVAQMAQLAGETPPTDMSGLTPETYEKGIGIKDKREAKVASQADARANLELKIAQMEQPTMIIDPTTGKMIKTDGVKGLKIINDQNGNPSVDRGPDYAAAPKVMKGGGANTGASAYATARTLQNIMTDLPSRSNPNTAAGAAYQVKLASRQGKSLISKTATPQAISSASVELARAVQRAAPHLTTLSGADFSKNLITQGNDFVQRLTANPSGKDVPKIRKQLYDLFNDMDKSASPAIDNQLGQIEDTFQGQVPPNWQKMKARERWDNVPDIPLYDENGKIVSGTGGGLQTLPSPNQGMSRIIDSTGAQHDIPTNNLDAARKRDPGLRLAQ